MENDVASVSSYFSRRLQNLIELSEKSGWHVSELPWDKTPLVPNGVERDDYIDMISQLYHAELFTLKVCSRLVVELPDLQAVRYVCTQMNEEARHAEAYARYINLIGEIAPVNEKLAKIFDKALAWNGSYCGLIVALNVVMEGEAINQQRKRIETLPCPIFKEINSRIVVDEGRHSAFGLVYLQSKLASLARSEKESILEWIDTLLEGWRDANAGRYTKNGAEVLRTSDAELKQRFKAQQIVFKQIGLAV